nr:ribonuclease H-like domain-containing protein [Tanacetum cinerariifolium]GFA46561.1 ribonuclease H-like domain-containing protein [Tanacetum cinerariifolium]
MSYMGELTFFLGLQVKQKEDGIFISQDKYVAKILKKFDFLSVKTASTPIETQKPLVKDNEAVDVDIHLYSMPSLEETSIFDDVYDDREVGTEADTNNLELSTVVIPIPTIRVYKDHPKEQIIRDLNLSTQTKRMLNFNKENDMEKASDHDYILLLFMPSSTQSLDDKDVGEVPDKGDEGVSKVSGINEQENTNSSTQDVDTAEPNINTASTNINTGSLYINNVGSNDPSMPSLEETSIFDDVYDDREV